VLPDSGRAAAAHKHVEISTSKKTTNCWLSASTLFAVLLSRALVPFAFFSLAASTSDSDAGSTTSATFH